MANRFVILGIHGRDVTTVNDYKYIDKMTGKEITKEEKEKLEEDQVTEILLRENNVARVRMFVGDKEIDEDFALPNIPVGLPSTQEMYTFLLKDKINSRMSELEKNNE